MPRHKTTKALTYARVSTIEQQDNGHGLEAQFESGSAYAAARGWEAYEIVDAGVSGGVAPGARPGLSQALEILRNREAQVLIAPKVDRLGRVALDILTLAAAADRESWALVVVDLGLDTSTASGRLTLQVLAAVAEFERSMISSRTKEALATAAAKGVRLGRPRRDDKWGWAVRVKIQYRTNQGFGLTEIANELNAEGAPTLRGGNKWYPSTVAGVLRSIRLDAEQREALNAQNGQTQQV